MTKRRVRNPDADKTLNSRSYKKAKTRAEDYIKDPEKLSKLVGAATDKAKRKSGHLRNILGSLKACVRLIKAYSTGAYRETPWTSLVMIIAAVIYFVMPIDLIPDFIVGFGYLDDAALLAWTVKTFSSDIDAFVAWEKGKDPSSNAPLDSESARDSC